MLQAHYFVLRTEVASFRIETQADTKVCGKDAAVSAYVGIKEEFTDNGDARGTNLTGSGGAPGVIRYDLLK
jgi:hypothetical protein